MSKKGIVYIMNTAVSGLIKIGTPTFKERKRSLEANGYYNVAGLKMSFAIEVEDYSEKEVLLHDIFDKHRVGNSELFALDQDLVKQLLLSFDGTVIYPENTNKEKDFDEISESRKQGALFSFYRKGVKDGDTVNFKDDPEVTAIVCGERDVEYGGQTWKLSPLTYKIYSDRNELNTSGAYQGAAYWEFNGQKLKDIKDKI